MHSSFITKLPILLFVSHYRIDHWDFEKERILLLTDKSLISVKYNFISQMVEEFRTIPLIYIREVIVGDFKYTHSYAQ